MRPEIERALVETLQTVYPELYTAVCRLVDAGQSPDQIRRQAAAVPGADWPGGAADRAWTIANYVTKAKKMV